MAFVRLSCAVAALCLPLALMGCGPGEADAGVQVSLLRVEDAPLPASLRFSWMNEQGYIRRDAGVRLAPRGELLAVVRVTTEEGARGRRWVIAHGIDADGRTVSGGAAVVDLVPGEWLAVSVRLVPGAGRDGDGDGVPDTLDACPGDPKQFARCQRPDGAFDGAQDPPDAAPPPDTMDPGMPPDGAVDALADGTATSADTAPPVDAAFETRAPVADGGSTTPDGAPPAPDTAATPDAAPPCRVLHLHGSVESDPAEAAILARLRGLSCAVTFEDEGTVKSTRLAGHDLVLIGPTSGNSPSYLFVKTTTLPVLVLEHKALKDLAMTGSGDGTDWGEVAAQPSIDVALAQHPLAAGLSGQVRLSGTATLLGYGVPAAAAAKVATFPGDARRAVSFAYDARAAMVGFTAPARRVAFVPEEQAVASMTQDGWRMFDAAVAWALGRR